MKESATNSATLRTSSYLEKFDEIHSAVISCEVPDENNTTVKSAEASINKCKTTLDKLFEKVWYILKDDEELLLLYKCLEKINRRRARCNKFKRSMDHSKTAGRAPSRKACCRKY